MKKLVYLSLGILALASCKKAALKVAENGCISQIATPRLTGTDSITVAGLMKSNNLSTNNLVFYAYQTYNALDQQNQMGDFQIADATYTQNGLPLFFYEEDFGFENGVLNGPAPVNTQTVNLDANPTLSLQRLRDSFLYQDKSVEYNPAIALGLKDSCLSAEFGYYNLNIDYPQKGVAIVKAWYVHPKNSQWPQGYFRDDTGGAILFRPLTTAGNVP